MITKVKGITGKRGAICLEESRNTSESNLSRKGENDKISEGDIIFKIV